MNKKIIGTLCLAIACTGAVVYSKHYVFNGSTSAESIMKDNVEALTDSETSPNNTGPAKLKTVQVMLALLNFVCVRIPTLVLNLLAVNVCV